MVFEIRVAIVGYVGAGKSTVLNAVLQGQYSDVGARRGQASVNIFRLQSKDTTDTNIDCTKSPQTRGACSLPDDCTGGILDSTVALTSTTSEIHETTCDVVIADPLCDMRSDTKLVLIDIPGLNEAGSKDLYRDYVNSKWTTFDCVVAVLDVFQGVNTEDQVRLLELVQKNLEERKKIPTIILCNKVDDPDDDEVSALVDEVRQKVNEIFAEGTESAPDEVTLSSLLNRCVSSSVVMGAPAFVPLSAENAYLYRTVSRLGMDDFRNMDRAMIERLGREEVGKLKWRKMTPEEKQDAAYNVVSNPTTCQENIQAANFHTFLEALKTCIGGSDKQLKLIEHQLEVKRNSLSFDTEIAEDLEAIVNINRLLGKPLYANYFWDTYQTWSGHYTLSYRTDMDHRSLNVNLSQLVAYGRLVTKTDKNETERQKVLEEMVSLVRVFLTVIVQSIEQSGDGDTFRRLMSMPLWDWDDDGQGWYDSTRETAYDRDAKSNKKKFYKQTPPVNNPHHWERRSTGGWQNRYTGEVAQGAHNPITGKISWETLTPRDLCTLCESILLVSYSKSFCEYFGREKIRLERYVQDYGHRIQRIVAEHNRSSEGDDDAMPSSPVAEREYTWLYTFLQGAHDETGAFIPLHPDKYELVAQVQMPERLSDPEHWGHVVWQFAEYADSIHRL